MDRSRKKGGVFGLDSWSEPKTTRKIEEDDGGMGNFGLARVIGCTFAAAILLPLTATIGLAVEPETHGFTEGQAAKFKGTIVGRDGETMKVRGDDNALAVVDLTNDTKVQLKHGFFKMSKTNMEVTALVPGLRVEVAGRGNNKGELVAERVEFDPNSYRASRQIDGAIAPLEGRQGTLEGRQGQLEGRAGQLEGRAGQLENQQKQTVAQVNQVQGEAQRANQGVDNVNQRVTSLDEYDTKDSATVYFKINSAELSDDAKKQLSDLAQKAQTDKGYMIEVAGFADSTGDWYRNQELSNKRAGMVVMYLQQECNVPLRRILAPAAMGISHAAADNNTKEGRRMNRRVEVKVLLNHALASSQQPGSGPGAATPGGASNSSATQPTSPQGQPASSTNTSTPSSNPSSPPPPNR